MTSQKMYELFMKALSDPGIKAELMEKISAASSELDLEGQTVLFPKDDISALTNENAELSRKIALLELENSRLAGENVNLSARLAACREELNEYVSSYGSQISLYKKFGKLSPMAAKTAEGFFKNNTLTGLFFCGVQTENLRSLRDFTERLIIEDYEKNLPDIAILDELYVYLLSCYNSTFTAPVYVLTDIKEGDEYSEEYCHNTGKAKSGKISRVLMQGCIAAANSKVVRKAIVRI